MSTLNDLKLVSASKPGKLPAIVQRRNKLSNKIWEQIQLAKAKDLGQTYAPMKQKRFKDIEGNTKYIEAPKRIKPWWFTANDGMVCLNIRYGTKIIEFAKGKTAVEVPNPKELIKALEIIKGAVEAGELDQQIELASGALKAGFGR